MTQLALIPLPPVCKRKPYGSKPKAEAMAKRMRAERGAVLEARYCEVCDAWHLRGVERKAG